MNVKEFKWFKAVQRKPDGGGAGAGGAGAEGAGAGGCSATVLSGIVSLLFSPSTGKKTGEIFSK